MEREGSWGGMRRRGRGEGEESSLLIGSLPPVLVHALFQRDDRHPADFDGQRAVKEDILESKY